MPPLAKRTNTACSAAERSHWHAGSIAASFPVGISKWGRTKRGGKCESRRIVFLHFCVQIRTCKQTQANKNNKYQKQQQKKHAHAFNRHELIRHRKECRGVKSHGHGLIRQVWECNANSKHLAAPLFSFPHQHPLRDKGEEQST